MLLSVEHALLLTGIGYQFRTSSPSGYVPWGVRTWPKESYARTEASFRIISKGVFDADRFDNPDPCCSSATKTFLMLCISDDFGHNGC